MAIKVLVAMSGGVDSSVAAALIKESGHEAVGATMKTFCYGEVPGSSKTKAGETPVRVTFAPAWTKLQL